MSIIHSYLYNLNAIILNKTLNENDLLKSYLESSVDILNTSSETTTLFLELEKHPYDILFLDIKFLQEDSQLLMQIREKTNYLKVILLYDINENITPFLSNNFDGFISFPLQQHTIHATMQKTIQEITLHKENNTFNKQLDIKYSHRIQKIIDHSDKQSFKLKETNKKFAKSKVTLEKNIQILTKKTKEILRQKNKLSIQNEIIHKNVLLSFTNLDGNITYLSEAYCKLTGYTQEEILGKNHSIFKHLNTSPYFAKKLWKKLLVDETFKGEFQNMKKDGSLFWVQATISPLFDENNQKIGYSSVKEDITNLKQVKYLSITDALTGIYNRRHFNDILNKELSRTKRIKTNFSLLMLDIDFFKQYNDLNGHQAGDLALQSVASVLQKNTLRGNDFAFRIGGEEFAIITSGMDDTETLHYTHKIKKEIEKLEIPHSYNKVSKFITASFGVVNISSTHSQISSDEIYNLTDQNLYDAKQNGRNKVVFNMSKVKKLSGVNFDTLTQLPDKYELFKSLKVLQKEGMLMVISLNFFSQLNQNYGGDITDQLIIEKSIELSRTILDKSATLYRLNFDEFAILITDEKQFEKYLSLMQYSMLQNQDTDIILEDKNYSLPSSLTIGVAFGTENILNLADTALKKAKKSDKNYFIYKKDAAIISQDKQNLFNLQTYQYALKNDDIIPYFQPIVDAKTSKIIKYEALARIKNKEGKIIPPILFLDSAKEDKTFEFFTRQMFQKVFQVYAKNNVEISVNISYENISSISFVEYLINRLEKYGGSKMTFEIVESEDIKDYKIVNDFISIVKKYGSKIAIDDFGSGYSNFTNLIQLNADFVKLDGSIISNIQNNKKTEDMAISLISFAKKINIKTVAEFVSSQEISQHMIELGIDHMQGYYYGKPESPQFYGLKE